MIILHSGLRKFVCILAVIFSFTSLKAQLPQPTLVGNTNVCLNSSAVFTATQPNPLTFLTFRWYQDQLIGPDILLSTSDSITLGPFLLPVNQTFKVETYNPINGESSSRLSFTVRPSASLNIDVPVAVPSDLVLCFGNSTTVTATSPLGNNTFRWYDALVGGDLLFEGNPYNTGPLTVLPTLFVASVNATGCESPRVPVPAITVLPALSLPIPVAQNPIICNSDTSVAYLSNKPAGTTVRWYDALLGGNLLFTGDTLRRNEDNTGIANLVSTYYAETEDANGCRSLRVPVAITKLPALDVPLVDPPVQVICSGESAEFTASSLLGGVTFKWYDELLGGNLLFTGPTFNTGPIENEGAVDLVETYYVSVEDANGCQSLRIPVIVTTLPALDLPIVMPPLATACANDSVQFTASSLLGNSNFFWYDALVGGNLLDSGSVFNTGPIANNSTANLTSIYYVEVRDNNGCKSIRTPATVVSLPLLDVPVVTPIAPLICSGDSVEFTANGLLGATDFRWYDDILSNTPIATGPTFNTGEVNNTGAVDLTRLFYVEAVDANGCTSVRLPVTLLIKPALDLPIANPPLSTVCNGQSATIAANSLLGSSTFNWYDELIGGSPVFTGDTFVTPPTSNSTGAELINIYYLEAVDETGCKSLRTPATVVTRPALDLPLVTPPLQTICNGQSAEFIAISTLGASVTFNWYDAVLGGNLVFTGDTFNTGPITNSNGAELTKIFSVEGVDEQGCVTLRVPVTVVVRPALNLPLALPLTQLICNGDSADFTATGLLGNGAQFFWYDVPLGGTPIDSGSTFNTGAINNANAADLTRIYYVELEDAVGCKSLRTPVTVIIRPALDVPLVLPPLQTICNGDSAEFIGNTLLNMPGTFSWYDDLLAGNLLFVGDTFNTGALTNQGLSNLTNTYFLEFTDTAGCKSIRTPAIAVIRPAIDVAVANPPISIVCNGDSATFIGTSVGGILGEDRTFNWYDQLLGGNLLFTGDTFTTPPLVNASGTDITNIYYLETVTPEGCTSIRTPVTSIVRPALDVALPFPLTQLICNGDSAEIVGNSVGGILGQDLTFNWYDQLLGGNLLFTGDTFNTGALFNEGLLDLVKDFYVEVVDTAGCVSLRTPATVIIRPALDLPLVNPPLQLACSGDSVNFVSTSLLGSDETFHWFDNIIGGNELFVGDTFNTGPIVNNGPTDILTLFYVEVEDTSGCRSIRVPATVLSIPAIDVPVVFPPAAVICNGDSAEFVASSLLGSEASYEWYDALIGGNLLFTGSRFNTGPINNNTGLDLTQTYYVQIVDTNGCSSVRVPAVVIVRPSIDVPIPVPLLDIICSGNSAQFTAISLLGGELRWYEDLTSTTPVFVGDTFTTETLFNTGVGNLLVDYFVESIDSAGCSSIRVPVEVLVAPGPSQPNVTPEMLSICSGQDVLFVASTNAFLPMQRFTWYDSEAPNTPIRMDDSLFFANFTFNGPGLLTKNYEVEVTDSLGCTSQRASVTLNVVPPLANPIVTPSDTSICSGNSVNFIANAEAVPGDYMWYSSDTSQAPIFVGDTFNTGIIDNPTTVAIQQNLFVQYVPDVRAGCSSGFTQVSLTVLPALDNPNVSASSLSVCEGESVVFSVDNLPNNTQVFWFSNSDLTTPLDSGISFVSPELNFTQSFSAQFRANNGCTSDFTSVEISVIPEINLTAPIVTCQVFNNDSIVFNWTVVSMAQYYEVSTNAGASFFTLDDSTATRTVFVKQSDELGANLIVRARHSLPCGNQVGPNSNTSRCLYPTVDPENPIDPIFNSFSPNGDGSNDVWTISDGLELYPENTVKIFNRWGKEVYSVKGYNNSNRAFTGQGLEDGAYFYILEIPELGMKKTGYVQLIR